MINTMAHLKTIEKQPIKSIFHELKLFILKFHTISNIQRSVIILNETDAKSEDESFIHLRVY